jgi:uncharacterized protein DUF1566
MLNKLIQLTIAAVLVLPWYTAEAAPTPLPSTGQTACYDSRGDVIPCTGTGQDGDSKEGTAWPTQRFTVNGNGTVTDNLTGLVWSKHANAPNPANAQTPCINPESAMLWPDALAFVQCLNDNSFAGFRDWRLPNPNELESVVNAGVADSSAWLNAHGFGFAGKPQTGVQHGLYWTSGSDASTASPYSAWDVSLVSGDMPASTIKNGGMRGVWPVRGVSSGPAPVSQTGQTGCFDDVGKTCNCGGTGEDGEHSAGTTWPANRIQANSNATFAGDKLTGLIWATSTQTPGPAACALTGLDITWQEALDHVKCLNQHAWLGKTDWRLPNKKELRSLVDYSTGGPALPAGHPFSDTLGRTYWSSTTDVSAPNSALAVSMLDGSLSSANKTALLPALPVAGPDLIAPALHVNALASPDRGTTKTVSGTVEAGVTPMVSVNNGPPVAAVVTGATWSAQVSGLATGANNINVIAADLVGNTAAVTAALTIVHTDGHFGAPGPVSVTDALKALRMAVKLVTPSADDILHGDCAPLNAPDGVIDAADALLILRKSIGLVNF